MKLQRDSNLDGVSLDVDGGDVGQVVSRWVVVDGSSSGLPWRRQNHRVAGGRRSGRGGGRCRLLSQHRERNSIRDDNLNIKLLKVYLHV